MCYFCAQLSMCQELSRHYLFNSQTILQGKYEYIHYQKKNGTNETQDRNNLPNATQL